jgi:hypothetical protein
MRLSQLGTHETVTCRLQDVHRAFSHLDVDVAAERRGAVMQWDSMARCAVCRHISDFCGIMHLQSPKTKQYSSTTVFSVPSQALGRQQGDTTH